MPKKIFKPKCIMSDRQMAFTSTGFVVPCCWIDSPGGRRDSTLKQFYQKEMHIDNFAGVGDVIDTPLYKDFIDASINGTDSYIPGEEGIKALEIILKAYQKEGVGYDGKKYNN